MCGHVGAKSGGDPLLHHPSHHVHCASAQGPDEAETDDHHSTKDAGIVIHELGKSERYRTRHSND